MAEFTLKPKSIKEVLASWSNENEVSAEMGETPVLEFPESKKTKKLSKQAKVSIGVGILFAIGTVAYFIYSKNK